VGGEGVGPFETKKSSRLVPLPIVMQRVVQSPKSLYNKVCTILYMNTRI